MASGNVADLVEGPFDRRIRGVNVNMTIAGMATVTERPGASNNAELFWDELLQGAANLTDMVRSPFKTSQKNCLNILPMIMLRAIREVCQ